MGSAFHTFDNIGEALLGAADSYRFETGVCDVLSHCFVGDLQVGSFCEHDPAVGEVNAHLIDCGFVFELAFDALGTECADHAICGGDNGFAGRRRGLGCGSVKTCCQQAKAEEEAVFNKDHDYIFN